MRTSPSAPRIDPSDIQTDGLHPKKSDVASQRRFGMTKIAPSGMASRSSHARQPAASLNGKRAAKITNPIGPATLKRSEANCAIGKSKSGKPYKLTLVAETR